MSIAGKALRCNMQLWDKKFSFDKVCICGRVFANGMQEYPCSNLGVVANDVAADLVESFLPQYGLGSLDGRGEDAIRSILAHRDAACSRARAAECWRDAGGGKGRSCAHESQETDGAANHTSNEETQTTTKMFLLFRRVRGGGGRTDRVLYNARYCIIPFLDCREKSRAHWTVAVRVCEGARTGTALQVDGVVDSGQERNLKKKVS
jgi:hypothetical protein